MARAAASAYSTWYAAPPRICFWMSVLMLDGVVLMQKCARLAAVPADDWYCKTCRTQK
jgi:hypothetical protein